MREFEMQMTQLMLFYGAAWLLGFIASCWLLYVIVKHAVREAINESRLTELLQRRLAQMAATPHGEEQAGAMPVMRADR